VLIYSWCWLQKKKRKRAAVCFVKTFSLALTQSQLRKDMSARETDIDLSKLKTAITFDDVLLVPKVSARQMLNIFFFNNYFSAAFVRKIEKRYQRTNKTKP